MHSEKSSIQKKRLTIPRRRISNTPPRLARARSLTKNASSRRPGLDDFDSLGDSDSSATEKDHLDSDSERDSSHPEKAQGLFWRSGKTCKRDRGRGPQRRTPNSPVKLPPPGREENAFKALPDSTVSPPRRRQVVSGYLYRYAKEAKDKEQSKVLQIPPVTHPRGRYANGSFRHQGTGENKSHLFHTLVAHLPNDAAPVTERLSAKPPTVSDDHASDRLNTRQRQVSKDFEKDNPKKHNVGVESADETEFEDVLPNILPVGVNEPVLYVARGKDGRSVRHAVSPPSKWGKKNPITHATPFLDPILIPHEHRANVMLSDPGILRANHHMVFWRAAYNHHATSAWEAADTCHRWKRAFTEYDASLTYFGRWREQI